MLELILHQRYRVDGIPLDLSPYRNHGLGVHTSGAPGPVSDSSAITFPQPDSQVEIEPSATQGWTSLVAVRVEVVARLDSDGGALEQGLLEAQGAFSFEVSQKALAAQIGGPDGAFVRAADIFSPDGKFHPVPIGRWVTLGVFHDGFSKIQLTMDGELVGQADVSNGVPPLQGRVTVGNTQSGDRPLLGRLDEVSVWRLDPKAMQREFLCRQINPEVAACLETFFLEVKQWAFDHTSAAVQLLNAIAEGERALVSGFLLLPTHEQARGRDLIRSFLQLWCSGEIGGEAMRNFVRHWLQFLDKQGLDLNRSERIAILRRIFEDAGSTQPVLIPSCDPELTAFLSIVASEVMALNGGQG